MTHQVCIADEEAIRLCVAQTDIAEMWSYTAVVYFNEMLITDLLLVGVVVTYVEADLQGVSF